MRTSFVAVAVSFSLAGCLVGEVEGTGTGDDDDGSGSNPGSGSSASPKLEVSVDKPTLSTELLTTNMVTVMLRARGGFAGPVTLAASAVDAGGAPLPAWSVTLDNATVNMTADGTATAVATVKIPSDRPVLTGAIKVDATSSLGASTAMSNVTVANQLTFKMALNGGACTYPVTSGTITTISQGTKVRWINTDAAARITIHINDNNAIQGFVHEPDPGMAPNGGTYEQTASSATGTVTWYCHAPQDNVNRFRLSATAP